MNSIKEVAKKFVGPWCCGAPMAPTLMTRKEVADFLRLSLDGVDTLVRRPEHPLPMLRAGRRLLFRLDAVLQWCEREAERPPPPRWRKKVRPRRKQRKSCQK